MPAEEWPGWDDENETQDKPVVGIDDLPAMDDDGPAMDWPAWDDEDKETEFVRSRSPRQQRRPAGGARTVTSSANDWFRQAMESTLVSARSNPSRQDSHMGGDWSAGTSEKTLNGNDNSSRWESSWKQSHRGASSIATGDHDGDGWRNSAGSWKRETSQNEDTYSRGRWRDSGDSGKANWNKWSKGATSSDLAMPPADLHREHEDEGAILSDLPMPPADPRRVHNDKRKEHGEDESGEHEDEFSDIPNPCYLPEMRPEEPCNSSDVPTLLAVPRKAAPKRTPKALSSLLPEEVPEEVQQLRVALQQLEERARFAAENDPSAKTRYDEKIAEASSVLQEILMDHDIFDEATMTKFAESDAAPDHEAEESPTILRFAGFFLHPYLNTAFTSNRSIVINCNPTYWSEDGDFFLYWESTHSRYQLCGRWAPSPKGAPFDLLADVRSGQNLFIAYEVLDEVGNISHWAELHPSGQMIPNHSVGMNQESVQPIQEMDVSVNQGVVENASQNTDALAEKSEETQAKQEEVTSSDVLVEKSEETQAKEEEIASDSLVEKSEETQAKQEEIASSGEMGEKSEKAQGKLEEPESNLTDEPVQKMDVCDAAVVFEQTTELKEQSAETVLAEEPKNNTVDESTQKMDGLDATVVSEEITELKEKNTETILDEEESTKKRGRGKAKAKAKKEDVNGIEDEKAKPKAKRGRPKAKE